MCSDFDFDQLWCSHTRETSMNCELTLTGSGREEALTNAARHITVQLCKLTIWRVHTGLRLIGRDGHRPVENIQPNWKQLDDDGHDGIYSELSLEHSEQMPLLIVFNSKLEILPVLKL